MQLRVAEADRRASTQLVGKGATDCQPLLIVVKYLSRGDAYAYIPVILTKSGR